MCEQVAIVPRDISLMILLMFSGVPTVEKVARTSTTARIFPIQTRRDKTDSQEGWSTTSDAVKIH